MKRRRYPEIELDIILALERFGALDVPDLSWKLSRDYRGVKLRARAFFDSLYRLQKVGAITKEGKEYSLAAPPPPPHTPISQNDREGQLLGD